MEEKKDEGHQSLIGENTFLKKHATVFDSNEPKTGLHAGAVGSTAAP